MAKLTQDEKDKIYSDAFDAAEDGSGQPYIYADEHGYMGKSAYRQMKKAYMDGASDLMTRYNNSSYSNYSYNSTYTYVGVGTTLMALERRAFNTTGDMLEARAIACRDLEARHQHRLATDEAYAMGF